MVQKEKLIEYAGTELANIFKDLWDACGYFDLKGLAWKHNKTGNHYLSLDVVLDVTNATEGRLMMIYRSCDGDIYCRELKEFLAKFTPFIVNRDD